MPQGAPNQRWTQTDTGSVRRREHMNKTDQNGSGATPRRKFDETYKRHAVELTLQGDRTVKTVAKDLGLPAWQLYDWRMVNADYNSPSLQIIFPHELREGAATPRPGDGGLEEGAAPRI